jgi:hypothetical protein
MKWAMRRRADNQSRLFGAMLGKLGIDAADAARAEGGVPLAAAARRCLGCDRALACGRWIEEQPAWSGTAPAFCPNVAYFARVRTETGGPTG